MCVFDSMHSHSLTLIITLISGAKVHSHAHRILSCRPDFPQSSAHKLCNSSVASAHARILACARPLANENKLSASAPYEDWCVELFARPGRCVVQRELVLDGMHKRELVYHVGCRVGVVFDCGCRQFLPGCHFTHHCINLGICSTVVATLFHRWRRAEFS